MKPTLAHPVVAARSAENEDRWGYHQFPALTRLPDGRILLMWADAADASETHGRPAPALVSGDDGQSWEPFAGPPRPTRPHFSVSDVGSGDYLTMPSQPYFDVVAAGIAMPDPVSESNVYGILRHYRLADFPAAVRDYFQYLPAERRQAATGQWRPDRVEYDIRNLLVWRRESSHLLPRTFFERPLLSHGGELLYADYRVRYMLADGTIAPKGASHLMVSTDQGRSFQRRATIAVDRSGADLYGEPQLAPTADGRLVCVIRKTDQQQKPMAITWSADRGHSWTPARDVFDFGVWPCVLLLGCGVMVLSYGRPGVHLRFDSRGCGEQWSDPVTLIAGNDDAVNTATCGYTSLMALTDQSFLIAYSDFDHRDSAGRRTKAILVRRVEI